MDPLTLILTALAAGAGVGAKEIAGSAVKDSYAALKGLLTARLAQARAGSGTVESYAAGAPGGELALREALETSGAAQDPAVLSAARRLLDATTPYEVDTTSTGVVVRDSQIGQLGHGNTGDFTFHQGSTGDR